MWSAITKIAAWLLGLITGPKDATLAQVTDSNARAQEQLTQERDINANLSQASAARTDADAGVVRAVASQTADNDPDLNAALRAQFPGQFRD